MKAILLFLLLVLVGCENAIALRGETGAEGPPGPSGARGPAGASAELGAPYVRRVEEIAEVGEDAAVVAHCDDGDHVIAGGCEWGYLPLSFTSHPLVEVDELGEDRPTAWICIARDVAALSTIRTHVVCLPGDP